VVVRSVEEQWVALLQALRVTYDVSEPASGRLVVTNSGRHQQPLQVELVMTPREFNEIVAIPCGSLDPAIELVLHQLAAQPADKAYLVYHQYDLEPSDSEVLPPDPALARLRAWREEHPGEYLTIWAYPPGDPRNERGGGPQSGPPPTVGG
jgi:hypothetical protein